MKRMVVTGCQGFVGGATLKSSEQSGWRAIGIGRRPDRATNYLQADLTQPLSQSLLAAIASADVVVHAAARSSPWGSKRQFAQANVHATSQLLDACQNAPRLPKFIFISSSSVYYQEADQCNIEESTPLAHPAVNCYAASKQICEQRVREYPGSWCILRPRAVYGRGDTVLFPRILRAARAGRLPLLVRQGEPVLGDLISIHNLVKCVVQAADEPSIQGDYNLTDGQPVPIIDFLLKVLDQLSAPIPHRRISVRTAFRIAGWLERIYGTFCPWIEPPITRFGVHVFAYSKTFCVAKMLRDFGPPPWSIDASVADFVEWVKVDNPYQ